MHMIILFIFKKPDEIQKALKDYNFSKDSEKKLLDHLNNQIEDPFTLIESYFKDGYLERLVRHQIESYNHFVNYQIKKTIDMFNPVKIHSENDYIVENLTSMKTQPATLISFDFR